MEIAIGSAGASASGDYNQYGGSGDSTKRSLFVFGSFSEGMVHFKKIESFVVRQRPATVTGGVYRFPSGRLVFSNEGTQTISGWVVEIKSADILLALLDEFHGIHRADPEKALHQRLEIQTFVDDGDITLAQAYCINLNKMPRGTVLVEGGDWEKSLQEKPPLFSQLTERQRAYIQRLGASCGREIVPIDLGLYRELMHLEIVVDKGRRLALTSLGQELYRMLV